MNRVYVDSNVFLYAIGTDHPHREPCRTLVRAFAEGQLTGETSVEAIQEIVHHRRRRGDAAATERGRRAAEVCAAVHPFDREVMLASLELIDRYPALPTRDAVHAATALAVGVTLVISADRDFDGVTGLERVDPSQAGSLSG